MSRPAVNIDITEVCNFQQPGSLWLLFPSFTDALNCSLVHCAVCSVKCDVSAQLTAETITRPPDPGREIEFHITAQIKLFERNFVTDIGNIIIYPK
jgi:hypothetical protein